MLSFARATVDDAPQLCDVMTRSFDDDARRFFGLESGGPPRYNDPNYQVELAEARAYPRPHVYYKILWDETAIGGIVVSTGDGVDCHLDLIFIDPDYQDRGVGGQCLDFLDQQYPAAQRWTLETPGCCTRNQHFYEKRGYVKIGESERVRDDWPAWHYQRIVQA